MSACSSARSMLRRRSIGLLVAAIAAASLVQTCSAFLQPLAVASTRREVFVRGERPISPQHSTPLQISALHQQDGAQGEKKVVIVGGGFAGLGAAHHLAQQGYQITLLDASPNPGGVIQDSQGRSIEAGVKGFWYQYGNIFRLLRDLGIKTSGEQSALTDWSTSSFFSDKGREVDSVVFQDKTMLPTPLGQFVHTLPTFSRLSVTDRLSLWRLAYALLDYQSEYEAYDSMSIADLMKRNGVSQALYRDFLEPLLLAMLFAPPESLSAAVIIGTFEFLALGHQANFDVKWCRGPIGERILTPLVDAITRNGGTVLGSHAVQDVLVDETTGRVTSVVAQTPGGGVLKFEADAVVIAVGVRALQILTQKVPALSQHDQFRRVLNLRASDCIAVRLTLDRRFATRSPANVMVLPANPGGRGVIRDVGATFFNLNDLHDDLRDSGVPSVIEVDLYHAASILPMSDSEIQSLVLTALRNAEPSLRAAKVSECIVMRAAQCATIFSPGSLRNRPVQRTPMPNLFLAGDFVREWPMHGADGLSQERALVTGLMAANLVIDTLGKGRKATILEVEKDEAHIMLGKEVNKALKSLPFPPPPFPLPF